MEGGGVSCRLPGGGGFLSADVAAGAAVTAAAAGVAARDFPRPRTDLIVPLAALYVVLPRGSLPARSLIQSIIKLE